MTQCNHRSCPGPSCPGLGPTCALLSLHTETAREAIANAISNGFLLLRSASDAAVAADMIESGVFGTTEDCLDEKGNPLRIFTEAVRCARSGE